MIAAAYLAVMFSAGSMLLLLFCFLSSFNNARRVSPAHDGGGFFAAFSIGLHVLDRPFVGESAAKRLNPELLPELSPVAALADAAKMGRKSPGTYVIPGQRLTD
jgi:hypothetical protein